MRISEYFRVILGMLCVKPKTNYFSEKKSHFHTGKNSYSPHFCIQIPTNSLKSISLYLNWKPGKLLTAMLKGHRYCPEILVIIFASGCWQTCKYWAMTGSKNPNQFTASMGRKKKQHWFSFLSECEEKCICAVHL